MIKLEANLNHSDLKKLKSELRNYKRQLKYAQQSCIRALAKYTKNNIQFYIEKSVNKEFSTGLLSSSIKTEFDSTAWEWGRVFTNLYYAKYVEYGTGIKGEGTYQGNADITYKGTPWSYYNERLERIMLTYGEEAHNFMYLALIDLKNNYKSICEQQFKKLGLK